MTKTSLAAVRPTVLRAGARLAVVSPASSTSPESVRIGVEHLRTMGFEPTLSPHALDRGPLYYAGTLDDRVADLHAAFDSPNIDGIICTRGGWGSAELLPHLDTELIRSNPKVFIGYSDHTSLHCWLQNEVGLITFYGPMVAADLAREGSIDENSWLSCLHGKRSWRLGCSDGLRVLREGVGEGALRGGCLSILTQSLGTPFAAQMKDSVLFLEDTGTKPYQWDRMLFHLRCAGRLDSVQGIVFGDMQQCVSPAEQPFLEEALLHSLRDFTGPIAIGLRCGHVTRSNITLPLGVRVRLDLSDTENPHIEFLEAAVKA